MSTEPAITDGAGYTPRAGRRRDAILLRQGITFEPTGEDGPRDRPLMTRQDPQASARA
jgi:hypothetical protein